MQGPSAIALRQGGQGGALKYKLGVQVVVKVAKGGPAPMSWKRKTTLQGAFGEFGQILEISVQDDQGCAIIEYDDSRDAEDAADAMNGKDVGGTKVNVAIRTDCGLGIIGRGSTDDRLSEMAQRHGLDATSTARLLDVFKDRSRRGCDINRDINELSEHLAASNKPSALICMKLADLRDGKPIGPCKFSKGSSRGERDAGRSERGGRGAGKERSRSRSGQREERRGTDRRDRRSRSRSRHREGRREKRSRSRGRR
eukprot:TRINITY_DN112478_c0_g1_i1.p1 TRINITY_DN112478_c0_g1~~TRINITY_DN112478_c0_g1_i1.p1  ORF type:complete len:255 (-),score=63.06 TRINITY_DN112478_c0_g1_i1:126-890(-)